MSFTAPNADVQRLVRVAAVTSASLLAGAGGACLAISLLVIETSDGFSITILGRTRMLPGSGLLGDFGTYVAEWQFLGMLCGIASALLVVLLRVRDRARREFAFVALVLSLGVAALFAKSIFL